MTTVNNAVLVSFASFSNICKNSDFQIMLSEKNCIFLRIRFILVIKSFYKYILIHILFELILCVSFYDYVLHYVYSQNIP